MADALKKVALKDSKKAERDGTLVGPGIEGLKLIKPVTHVDHRGALFEVYDADPEKWPDPVVWIYQTSLYPGVIKGWFVHEHKTDRYTLMNGTLLAAFYDGREDSPTYGNALHATMSDRGIRQIVIPAGVWHVTVNVGQEEALLLNFPTRPHNHEQPDRSGLPWDTDLIPLDLKTLMPANWMAR
jgi:dTDP-4-dehydrorhamnose 3,5-epimerase